MLIMSHRNEIVVIALVIMIGKAGVNLQCAEER